MAGTLFGAVLGALPDHDVDEVLARTAKPRRPAVGPKTYFALPDFPGEDVPKFNTRIGKMLMGRFTRNHKERLERIGYETEQHYVVVEKNGVFQRLPFMYIFHNGFVDKVHVNDLPQIADDKKMLHYKTKVIFNDGTYAWGIPACKLIGSWATLMANPVDDPDEIINIRNEERLARESDETSESDV